MSSRPPREEYTCYLDCLRKNPVRTVNGVPVDIPKMEYCKIISWAGLLGLSYLLIGYASIETILFSSSYHTGNFFDHLHLLFSTIACQLLTPLGILMTSSLNGPSAPLKPAARKINHVVLQVFAFIFNLVGIILVFLFGSWTEAIDIDWVFLLTHIGHPFFGLIALILSGLTIMVGPMIFCKSSCSQRLKHLHICLGLSTYFYFSLNSLPLFWTREYRYWHHESFDMPLIASISLCLSTVIIVTFSAYKLVRNNRSARKNVLCK